MMGEDCCKVEENKADIGNVTCPKCSHIQPMEIPTNSCQAFYKCEGCNETISAEKSCCVFCDYGDQKCPVASIHEGEEK
jgi:hypothetical protein